MSTSLGDKFPSRILDYLSVENENRDNTVIFLLTSDNEGFPHVALLSPFQVVTTKDSEFLMTVHHGTNSQKFLQRMLKGALILQADPAIDYVKFEVELIEGWKSARDEVLYRATPVEILEDYSEKVPYLSQLKFDSTEIIKDYSAGFKEIKDYISSH